MMVTVLYNFFAHMFVKLYFLKYDKKEPFGIVQNFAFEMLVDTSLKVTILYLPWKTNC